MRLSKPPDIRATQFFCHPPLSFPLFFLLTIEAQNQGGPELLPLALRIEYELCFLQNSLFVFSTKVVFPFFLNRTQYESRPAENPLNVLGTKPA